ncbi:hypothetical protein [Paenibacillus xylanexedens]|uniref:hypothetical protein n=1 Tax=Paenibacillus xylanexedens TaxID=528191 RepID=UPI001C92ED05|nr:hypothetical protein [Paenibacillus xylanexedens]
MPILYNPCRVNGKPFRESGRSERYAVIHTKKPLLHFSITESTTTANHLFVYVYK